MRPSGEVQVQPWWRVSGGLSTLREDLKFSAGATGIAGVRQNGKDPKVQASLRSSMDLGRRFTLDGDVRYVGALSDGALPAYVELNGRFGWMINDRLQFAVSGRNLLHERHVEYPGATPVQRTVSADLQWRF